MGGPQRGYAREVSRFSRGAVRRHTSPAGSYDTSTEPLKSSCSTREIRRDPKPTPPDCGTAAGGSVNDGGKVSYASDWGQTPAAKQFGRDSCHYLGTCPGTGGAENFGDGAWDRDGYIAANCNLEEERRANRKFIELETRGGNRAAFAEAIGALGCEYALAGERRIKLIMNETVEIGDLYRLALRYDVQIRRLNFKRDSLEDIFLKAMENGADAGAGSGAPVTDRNAAQKAGSQVNGRANDGGL